MTRNTITLPRSVVEQALEVLQRAGEQLGNTAAEFNAIEALRAALEQPQIQSGGIPPNWKLVPVEPTEKMIDIGRSQSSFPDGVYRAMLAAAPQPPVVEQPQVEQEPFTVLVRKHSWLANQWEAAPRGFPDYGRSWADERVNVYTHQQPRREPLTDGEIVAMWRESIVGLARSIERAHGIGGEA